MGSLPTQTEFIDYLSGLAKQTRSVALIVKQERKGIGAGGDVEYIWAPKLPEAYKPRSTDAIYGNTGAFKPEALKEKLSASKANCDFCICMVLDDINTKAKEPPLAPTWVIETSPGSFQWGYAFSVQPTTDTFTSAITAIGAAGYTDASANNAVRNFRLPGSVNLKPGRDKFKSKLISFDGERKFTLDEICTGLGVTPGESRGRSYRSTNIKRENDEVLKWLSDNKYLLSERSSEGWYSVVCPNHHKHTVPTDVAARYSPHDRAFCCYHEHCSQETSQGFLDWIYEQGGPRAFHGPDEAAFAKTMSDTISKLEQIEKLRGETQRSQTVVAQEQAKQSLNDIVQKQAKRTEKTNMFSRFAYVTADDTYFDMEDRKEYSRSVFNAMFRHLKFMSIHGDKPRKVEASIFFDENRDSHGCPLTSGVTYAPGESKLVGKKGEVFCNRWRDGRPTVDKSLKANIDMWLNHGRKLIPNEEEFQHILNVMAFKLQNPNIKINHAVLHAGREGCGKDTFWAPFIWAVCGPDYENRGYLDSATLSTPWGYHLESEVLLINELREPTMSERQALANNLKPIIAAPPEFLDVNRKGLHPFKAVNRTFVLAFSNSRTPISLAPQDRRWFVIWSESPRIDGSAIWRWYKSGGFEAVAAYLYQRDVSAFNPAGTPFETEHKTNLIEGGMSTVQAWLVYLAKNCLSEFQNGVVGSPFFKIADRLQGQAPSGAKVHHAGVVDALQDAGWYNLGQLKSRENQARKQIWVSPEIYADVEKGDISRSAIRNMAEQPTGVRLVELQKGA